MFATALITLAKKGFWPWIFFFRCCTFSKQGSWALILAHARQYRRMVLVYFGTSCLFFIRGKCLIRISFLLCIEDSFLTIIALSEWEDRKNGSILHFSPFKLVSRANETLKWRHKVDCRPWALKAPNILTLKMFNIQRKNPGSKTFFAIVNRAVAKVYLSE